MAEVTPPANLYAVNINVQKNMEAEIKKSEIKTVEIMPQRQEIHKISSPREMQPQKEKERKWKKTIAVKE